MGSPSASPTALEKAKISPVEDVVDEEEDSCSICLQPIEDRTIIPACSHEFCFDCLVLWIEQSRKCPLCSQNVGEHLIHRIRSRYDYEKYYLPPLRQQNEPQPLHPLALTSAQTRPRRRRHREPMWGRRTREEQEEMDRLDRAIEFRKRIYDMNLYAKHVASNSHTRYRPYPLPAKFASSPDLISRTTQFLRRELRVWPNLDIEFLTSLIISLMKAIDIRSERAVKLLAEFLDMDGPYIDGARHRNAEHLAHEIYSYIRSPYTDLFVYDSIVQYDDGRGNEGESSNAIQRLNPTSPRNGKRPRSRSKSPPSFSVSKRAAHSKPTRQRKLEPHTSSGGGVSSPPVDDDEFIRSHVNQNVVTDAKHPTSDAKGKGRVVSGNDEQDDDDKADSPLLSELHHGSDHVPQRQPKPLPRVRNRSLRESVNAHLYLRGGINNITSSRSSEPRGGSKPHEAGKPPLLARLSDPVPNASILSPIIITTDARREVLLLSSCHPVSPPSNNNPSPCHQGISKISDNPRIVHDTGNDGPPPLSSSLSETTEELKPNSDGWESESARRNRKQSGAQSSSSSSSSTPAAPAPVPLLSAPSGPLKTGGLHVAMSESRDKKDEILSDPLGQFSPASRYPSYPRNKLLARLQEEKSKSTLSHQQSSSSSSSASASCQSESTTTAWPSGILLTDSNADDDRDLPSPTRASSSSSSSVSIVERMDSERVEAKLRDSCAIAPA